MRAPMLPPARPTLIVAVSRSWAAQASACKAARKSPASSVGRPASIIAWVSRQIGTEEIVTAAIRVEGREQAVLPDHLV